MKSETAAWEVNEAVKETIERLDRVYRVWIPHTDQRTAELFDQLYLIQLTILRHLNKHLQK